MYDWYKSYTPAIISAVGNVTKNATVAANFAFGLFDITGSKIQDIE